MAGWREPPWKRGGSGLPWVPWSRVSEFHATVDCFCRVSNSTGVRMPSAECRRWRLWKISRYSKIALASSTRVRQILLPSSSTCIRQLHQGVVIGRFGQKRAPSGRLRFLATRLISGARCGLGARRRQDSCVDPPSGRRKDDGRTCQLGPSTGRVAGERDRVDHTGDRRSVPARGYGGRFGRLRGRRGRDTRFLRRLGRRGRARRPGSYWRMGWAPEESPRALGSRPQRRVERRQRPSWAKACSPSVERSRSGRSR